MGAMHAALTDVYFNTTEMAGFYGWMGSVAVGQNERLNNTPRIETSSSIYGYNRQFWDAEYGNIGGDGMEILRRFVPDDKHKNYVNDVRNRMPSWLPGDDYFHNFQVGDAYGSIPKGEMRLPGESYEKMYDIDMEKALRLEVNPSTAGYDVETIVGSLLGRDEAKSKQFQDILDEGTEIHKEKEQEFKDLGIAVSSEQYVQDEATGMGGYYDMEADQGKMMDWAFQNAGKIKFYKAANGTGLEQYEGLYHAPVDVTPEMAADIVATSPRAAVDFKTRSENKYQAAELAFENAQQINFYGGQLGTGVNAVIEYSRDNPEAAPNVILFEQSDAVSQHMHEKVLTAQAAVRQMMEDGAVGRGDLYGTVDRYRILADVAPYSNEFRTLRSQLPLIDLTPDERAEITEINSRLSDVRDNVRTYDYRFQTAEVERKAVTVRKIIDNNTFLTDEFSDNPIRLAGVYVPNGQDEAGQAATEFLNAHLQVGQKVQISVTADEMNLVNNDTYKTIDAVVHPGGGVRNLNKELIDRGLAREEEDDYSAAAVHARFTPIERAFGSAWESFAHLDTPFHTKLLQVASPLEQYKRREVYGKNFQDWASPIDDYLIPWYQNWLSKAPLAAITMGTFIGQFFGDSRYGNIMGGLIGGAAAEAGVVYTKGQEAATGERWIPDRRKREREVVEYFDALKFVKNRALYEEAADVALQREGFDVRRYMDEQKEEGGKRQGYRRKLEEAKRSLQTKGEIGIREARKYVGRHGSVDEYMSALNAKIEEVNNRRKVDALTPAAADAIRFYQESEKTLYGYDPGEPLQNALGALPKKERDYVNKFLKAPERERQEILEVVPGYVRRILQSSWGMEVDEKPELEEMFAEYGLPDADWMGWDPRADLDNIQLKVVQREGLDQSDFNMWGDDEQQAAMVQDSQVPSMKQKMRPELVEQKLKTILGEAGFRDLQISVEGVQASGIQMDVNVRKDRRAEAQAAIKENAHSIV